MSKQDWDNLTHVEECFFINAMEMDLLPGVFGDLTEAERRLPLDDLARILSTLIDRGWIELRRYARWISEEGLEGLTPGDAIPCSEVARILADPNSWEYPDDPSWIGALTLVRTEAGLVVSQLSPEEIAERDQAPVSPEPGRPRATRPAGLG